MAKWIKISAKVVTTKERNLNEPYKKEGSPIPGVELFDVIDGKTNDLELLSQMLINSLLCAI